MEFDAVAKKDAGAVAKHCLLYSMSRAGK